jgi:hypothetical protein
MRRIIARSVMVIAASALILLTDTIGFAGLERLSVIDAACFSMSQLRTWAMATHTQSRSEASC